MNRRQTRLHTATPADRLSRTREITLACAIVVSWAGWANVVQAQEKPAEVPTFKHQITGLFCPEREQDLRDLCEQQLTKFKLVSVDYANSEATFAYDPAVVFPGAKPEQYVERLNNELRSVSRYTFGAKPLRTMAKDQLKRVEIPIAGLDCKACSLAVYEIIAKLPGVEQAQASFRLGRATAYIDPTKIDQARIEMELKQRGVSLATTP